MNYVIFAALFVVLVLVAANVESKNPAEIDEIEAIPPMAMARMMFHSKTSHHSRLEDDYRKKEKRSVANDWNENRSNSRRDKVRKSKLDKVSSRSAFGRYYRFQNAKRTKLSS